MRDIIPRVLQIDHENSETLSRAKNEAARAWEQIDRVNVLLSKLAEERMDRVKKI